MRLGYFGGSFDPPHAGHLTVARAARDRFALDEILLAPTGRQPLKPNGPAAPFADRVAMVELLCEGQQGLRASTVDAPHLDGSPNYTVDTLRQLRAASPDGSALFAIVGADAFLTLPHWHEAGALMQLAEWIIVSRPGIAEEQVQALSATLGEGRRAHLLGGVANPTSATQLRAQLRSRQPCEHLLPPALCSYIAEHGLYVGG